MGIAHIRKWFARSAAPKQEFLAYAVMLSWHPGAGFAVYDPLAGRHFTHQPGTSIIRTLEPPSKLAADYFPAGIGLRAQLPRELTRSFNFRHKVLEQNYAGTRMMVEQFEMGGVSGQSFVYQRRYHPDGRVEVEASYGDLKKTHLAPPSSYPLNGYLEALRSFARPLVVKPKAA